MDEADDPTITDGDHYTVVFENDRVRVLEYRDVPGDRTNRHRHPDSVMVTLSAFRRRISSGDRSVELELAAEQARWVAAQEHVGENIGDTPTHAIFVELKGDAAVAMTTALGPEG
ncbi:cytoplasmic protein [Microbacterium fluvii]|uniref:Cytoplasmic protein n=1 Tax=Microbacterium fluvii TaxID=415215 RepID=A0ABW2HGH9_9MICO|nr:cytoplasmic protein [Microbacterium fluvii]MCU4673901.1 cytoplasmic protein [Microbacterium fluvii]